MKFTPGPIRDSWLIDPAPHVDTRGRFFRAWCLEEFRSHGIGFAPVQANIGTSHRAGTLRGLHYQVEPYPEAKLVRCTRGAVFDVLVDLRPDSPSYGRWDGAELSADNGRMLLVPPLCAHGYQTLTDEAEIFYFTSAVYAPTAVRGVRYDDPALAIAWPRPAVAVSDQDLAWPLLAQQEQRRTP